MQRFLVLVLLVAVSGLAVWGWSVVATPGEGGASRSHAVGEDVAPAASPAAVGGGEVALDGAVDSPLETREQLGPSQESTVVRGVFQAPGGAWPGGGEVQLLPTPDSTGLAGMLSEMSRAARAEEFQESMREWVGRDPVATVPLSSTGEFVFVDPPAGRYALSLVHPDLLEVSSTQFSVVQNEVVELGGLPTRPASSLLVLVSDESGQPVPGASVRLTRRVDVTVFMDPSSLSDVASIIRKMVPKKEKTDERGACRFTQMEGRQTYHLYVNAPALVEKNLEVAVAEGRGNVVPVELAPGGRLVVRVQDAVGEPFEGARIDVRCPGVERPMPFSFGGGAAEMRVASFSMWTSSDGAARLAGLPAGPLEIDVLAAGFLSQRREAVLSLDEELDEAFELDQGITVAGRVVDEQGRPVPGARVMHMSILGTQFLGMDVSSVVGLDLMSLGMGERSIACDDSGRFVIGGFASEEAAVLLATAPGFEPVRTPELPAGATDIEIRLLRSCGVSGVVVAEPAGAPVPEFEVTIQQRMFLVVDRPVAEQAFSGRTDGSFSIESLPREVVTLVVKAPGHPPATKSVDLSEGAVDAGEIRLLQPAAIEGAVFDPDGNPLEGAAIRVARGGFSDALAMAVLFGGAEETVYTDASGAFRLENLSGRGVRLLGDMEGYAPLRSRVVRLTPGDTTSGVFLEFSRGGAIRGQIVDPQGKPLSGWRVQASHAGGRGIATATTDAGGVFSFDGLASGTHKLDAFPEDYISRFASEASGMGLAGLESFDIGSLIGEAMRLVVTDRVVVRDGEESEVVLTFDGPTVGEQVGVTLTGHARLGAEPLSQGMVVLLSPSSETPRHMADIEDGNYRIEGVRPGSYTARVQRDMFRSFLGKPTQVVVGLEAEQELDFALPGGRLAGAVIAHDSKAPVTGVVLSLMRPEGGVAWGERFDVGEGTVVTDARGAFQFEGLEPGSYEIFAKEIKLDGVEARSGRLSHLLVSEAGGREDLVLNIRTGSGITVSVRDGMGPRSNALVMLLDPEGRPIDLFHRVLTDPEGVATFTDVPPGRYRISVDAPACAPKIGDVVHVAADRDLDVDVFLSRGVPVSLEVTGGPPPWVRGEVLKYAVFREDGAMLRTGRLVVPEEEAQWEGLSLGYYAPGSYVLKVQVPRLGLLEVGGEVPDSGTSSWSVELPRILR